MNSTAVKVLDGKLLVNGKVVPFAGEVAQALHLGETFVIAVNYLYSDPSHTPFRNIFCLYDDGRILWQIEEFKEVTGREGYYMNVWLTDSGELVAGHPLGFDCVIDKRTGKIKSYDFTK